MAQVLVVEDDSAIRAVLQAALTASGHEVWAAEDGRAGLRVFDANKIDLVITDMLMPNMDGAEFIRRLRAYRPSVKIVAISGGSRARDRRDLLRDAVALGADAALPKPIQPSELRGVVAALLGLPPPGEPDAEGGGSGPAG